LEGPAEASAGGEPCKPVVETGRGDWKKYLRVLHADGRMAEGGAGRLAGHTLVQEPCEQREDETSPSYLPFLELQGAEMRSGYIEPERTYTKKGDLVRKGCSRGGIGYGEHDDYEVEIGQSCNFSFEMFALCCMHDEIIEFLQKSDDHIGRLLFSEYRRQISQWLKEYSRKAEEIEKDEVHYAKLYDEKQKEVKNAG
jgi:hypothetical protein